MTGSWKLVPVEADPRQVRAYRDADVRRMRYAATAKRDYAAMISAAPTPPDEVLVRVGRMFETARLLGDDIPTAMRAALSAVGEKTGE